LILKRQPTVPDAVTGGQDTVGLRVPNHPLALELLHAFDGGIAAPSANRFGRISPTRAEHVREELGDKVVLVQDGGPCGVGIESTIVDLSGAVPRILRPGAITAADIERVLRRDVGGAVNAPAPRVSGSLEAHYAPTTPLRLLPAAELHAAAATALAAGQRCAVLAFRPPEPAAGLVCLAASGDAAEYARDLYAALRRLDHAGVDLILVAMPPDTEYWQAAIDRLRRAACGSGVE
jgi:L-threonylcarbamoyladenylate synthase